LLTFIWLTVSIKVNFLFAFRLLPSVFIWRLIHKVLLKLFLLSLVVFNVVSFIFILLTSLHGLCILLLVVFFILSLTLTIVSFLLRLSFELHSVCNLLLVYSLATALHLLL
jgi:hypothetical protein